MDKPAILGGRRFFRKEIPFSRPTLPKTQRILKNISASMDSGMITNSKFVKKLEDKAAKYLNVKHCVAVTNCTSGLMLTFRALGLTGEVIVPSYTFPATVLAILWNGLKPVFVDIDPKAYNIDPACIESRINSRTSAIVAVYVYGNPPDINGLEKIAKASKLKLIFDAAHAFGSKYNGRFAGGFGDAEIFSLSPTKLITAGEGGLITTDNYELAKKLIMGRNYADPGDYNCRFIGLNARMPESCAILGIETLQDAERCIARRNKLARLYKLRLKEIPGIYFHKVEENSRCTFKDFSVYIEPKQFGLNRDGLAASLKAENIPTRYYFYPAVHKQIFFKKCYFRYKVHLPVTEKISGSILSLPIYSHMPEEDVEKICLALKRIYKFRKEIRKIQNG